MKSIEIIFRFWKNVVIALFPYIIDNNRGDVMCYQHIGQHGSADYGYIIESSKPATKEQYQPLLNELVNDVGYLNLKIVKKRNYKRFAKLIE
jgi:hypothetical protein